MHSAEKGGWLRGWRFISTQLSRLTDYSVLSSQKILQHIIMARGGILVISGAAEANGSRLPKGVVECELGIFLEKAGISKLLAF